MINRLCAFGVVLAVLAATAAAQAPSVPADSRAFVRTWLLCGPFPNPRAEGVKEYRHDETTLGYYIDYLKPIGGEEGVKPSDGLTFTSVDGKEYAWRLYTSPADYVDLCQAYEQNQGVVAYAACTVVSDSEQEMVIALGSNDGVKAWLNGETIWDNHRPRGAEPGQDYVRATLRQGENLLLLKVDQGLGNWGLYANLMPLEEARLELLRASDAEVEFVVRGTDPTLEVVLGRTSKYLIFDDPPTYGVSLVGTDGKTVASQTATLGTPLTFDLSGMPAGAYRLLAGGCLPTGQVLEEEAHFFHGASPWSIRVCGGSDDQLVVEMLDADFEVVEYGITGVKDGVAHILRADVQPFFVRILRPSVGLGKRFYLADNGGKGFTLPQEGPLDIDLAAEALETLRDKARRFSKRDSGAPDWLRSELKKRLAVAKGCDCTTEALGLLSTSKCTLFETPSLAVWCAPGIEKVARHEAVPRVSSRAVHVSLARNEYEPFQIVLRPTEDLCKVSFSLAPFESSSGSVLPDESIAVNAVDYIEIEDVSDYFGTPGPWPDALPQMTDDTVAKSGENTPFWFTVHAAENQPAGVYKGEVTIQANGDEIARVPVGIQIYDFTLPHETHTETAYGVGVNPAYHGGLDEAQMQEVHDLYMRLCAEHRISPYAPHARAGIGIRIEGEPQHATVDFAQFDKAMTRYLDDFAFTSFNMGHIPGELGGHPRYSDEYVRLFTEAYQQVQEHLREKGWLDKAYWYWVDEPPKSRYAEVKRGMELLRQACPDIRRLLTCNQEDAPVPYFHGTVNLWVPIMDRYDPARAQARQALGETVWWYVCTGPKAPYPNNFIDHPAINHRIRFWVIDRYGLDGSLYWSVTYWAQNPWEQAMSVSPSGGPWGNGDGRLLYPPARTKPDAPLIAPPVSSIRFENLRDGIEDREYMVRLRSVIERGGGKGRKAEEALHRAHTELAPTCTCYEQNPLALLAARHAMAMAAEGSDTE